MARTEPITRLEIGACPTHRTDVKHYGPFTVGCACLSDEQRDALAHRLNTARAEGHPLAEMAE